MKAATKKAKNKIKVKHFIWGVDTPESPTLKISVNLESVAARSTQLAGLVLTLIKFELIRRNAYDRWRLYLNQAGLKFQDLIAYLNVLYDDEQLVRSLRSYHFKSISPEYDKIALKREAYELYHELLGKIEKVKVLNSFPVHNIRAVEQIPQF
jgi:hypothetical protein